MRKIKTFYWPFHLKLESLRCHHPAKQKKSAWWINKLTDVNWTKQSVQR